MPPTPDDALQAPQDSASAPGLPAPPARGFSKSPLASLPGLPYRRSNTALSTLFASTSALPPAGSTGSPSASGTITPTAGAGNGSVFSPGGSTVLPSPSSVTSGRVGGNGGLKELICRAFSPHVSVLASKDTEELIRHKGINGGLLELLRPFGEHVQGKVTVRDSSGVSRSWEDFAVRFIGPKDGLEAPRSADRRSTDSAPGPQTSAKRTSLPEYKPARFRTGGDVPQIEELIERHLTYSEENSGPVEVDYINSQDPTADANALSPFYTLYVRRLLSGLPLVPSETFSHPVAAVIAISSRSPSPIEELRSLYDSSNAGDNRLPQWVHNEFLRYYVLIHDEDYDDITKSMALYDQMKRHFGLHCHLLRLRSTQSVPSDDDSVKLPHCEWGSATEELAEIMRREADEDDEDPTPYIFESDASALRAFVREMVTQSIVPSMERDSATWNDQVASRRRGLSGRFMSLSKRFTAFGNRNSTGPSIGGGGSNYDSLQGFYRPDAPEAVMRKLADYAMMIRDYKLAQSVYEILCQDFKSDKAWRHYAGANEMAAVSTLLSVPHLTAKLRAETIDQYIDNAYYSYITRVGLPYNALRTLILALELLKLRGGSALDDAARWATKILDDRLVGPVGHALLMERIAHCFTERRRAAGPGHGGGDRRRKSAFWHLLAADAWLRLEKATPAEKCLGEALRLYRAPPPTSTFTLTDEKLHGSPNVPTKQALGFDHMSTFLLALQDAVDANRAGPRHLDGDALLQGARDAADGAGGLLVEPVSEEREQLGGAAGAVPPSPIHVAHRHRKSLSATVPPLHVVSAAAPDVPPVPTAPHGSASLEARPGGQELDPLGALIANEGNKDAIPVTAVPASPLREKRDPKAEGFE